MKKEEFCEVFGDISEKYVKEARADRKAKNIVRFSGKLSLLVSACCLWYR